ncbi:putative methyltransferase YcgJ [Aquisphaera giovannonii]|uniref:Putative methyltransferase YcgJ n=1 Tax=Aquisphaera giovannonii TaxID=406548 RepID=A0A5B9W9V7_9BACT|nr:class I SAM-dependent methyltransferase [Aquisphaera giovannonii]QEH37418.1 putative methyltransferase YcgJ [Aquisphaera giovannonii]
MNEPMTVQPELTRTEQFGRAMTEMLNQAGLAMMTSIGHRVGLFDAMSGLPPASCRGVAEAAGLDERYVREWLGAMVAGGVVDLDRDAGLYRLPDEHAAWLTRQGSLPNAAGSAQWVAVLAGAESRVVEAFRHGRGVPYSAYDRFHEVMAEQSHQTVVSALLEQILPMAPGLMERLEGGLSVVDVGCGAGRALLRMAGAFPASRFLGIDASPEAIALAQDEAGRRGTSNARFQVMDAAALGPGEAFDLVTAFDAIHDQARPEAVLRAIHDSLRPGGIFLMQDISGSGCHHADRSHAFGTFLYAISCMHCMSVSLANGGPGLGAMWGKPMAQVMLREAGFGKVETRESPHDPLNFYYIATKG